MKSKILSRIPLDQVAELARLLLQSGVPTATVIQEVASFIDDLVDWREVVRGLGGELLEAADGPIALAIASVVVAIAAR